MSRSTDALDVLRSKVLPNRKKHSDLVSSQEAVLDGLTLFDQFDYIIVKAGESCYNLKRSDTKNEGVSAPPPANLLAQL